RGIATAARSPSTSDNLSQRRVVWIQTTCPTCPTRPTCPTCLAAGSSSSATPPLGKRSGLSRRPSYGGQWRNNAIALLLTRPAKNNDLDWGSRLGNIRGLGCQSERVRFRHRVLRENRDE